jgi:hypothetical protein
MPAWLEKNVSVGDVLTVFSILIAAFAAITTWRTEIQTRQRNQADGVRKAAAEVVAKMERRYEISQWIFEDIQPDIVAATIMATGQSLPAGAHNKPLDPNEDDTIRRLHVFAARDFLYKQIAEAHQRNRKRQLCDRATSGKWHSTGLSIYQVRCRSWVKNGSVRARAARPFYPQEQTSSACPGMPVWCHFRTHAPQQNCISYSITSSARALPAAKDAVSASTRRSVTN